MIVYLITSFRLDNQVSESKNHITSTLVAINQCPIYGTEKVYHTKNVRATILSEDFKIIR